MPSETLTATDTPDRIVTAVLNYLQPSTEKPKRYSYDRPGLPQWTGVDDPRAITDPDAPADMPPRQSIEIRTIAFFEN
jgi:hypothetical protein